MDRTLKVAVVGATGLVGREIIEVLAERQFPVGTLLPLASERSVGEAVAFGGEQVTVAQATPQALAGADLVLMSAGAEVSRALSPAAVAHGAWVVDNSSAFRMDAGCPLVVPEVNAQALEQLRAPGIVANPNCSTIQLVVALAALHREAGLTRVVASTYQAVSGRGQVGIDELSEQVSALWRQEEAVPQAFAKRIAFNCLPQIDALDEDGHSFEERKMVQETRKILAMPKLDVLATCVRVPTFNGHGVSVTAWFERPLTRAQALALLRVAPGVLLVDELDTSPEGPPEGSCEKSKDGAYPTSLEAEGQDATLVGRVRVHGNAQGALSLWCVADNLRKGAATNAVQLAELLLKNGAFAAKKPA